MPKPTNAPRLRPHCQTNWHILSCPKRSLLREELLHTLGDTLANNHTQPNLALMLLQGIGIVHCARSASFLV
jgi:hypothetical protein